MTTKFEGAECLPPPRHNANGVPVFVGFPEHQPSRSLPTFLKDLSLGGALIESPAPLPDGTVVLIRMMKSGGAEAVKARVIKVIDRRKSFTTPWWKKRTWLIRVAFLDGCSYEFFRAAIDGLFLPTHSAAGAEVVPEGFTRRV